MPKILVSMFVNVIVISEDAWCKCLCSINSCSVNSRHQLIQYKVIHRLHHSCVKLHSFSPSINHQHSVLNVTNQMEHCLLYFGFAPNFVSSGWKFFTATLTFMDMIFLLKLKRPFLAGLDSWKL